MSAERSDTNAIEVRASEWILRRDRGALAPQDRAELEAWLSSDSRHRDAYLRLLEAWDFAAAGLKIWRPADGRIDPNVLAGRAAPKTAERRWPLAMAATLVLAVAALSIWYVQARRGVYATAIGGYQRVLLADGSVLQLNTDSKVRVRQSERRREVRLLRGEAYFDIAQDARRPFDVMAGGTMVRAVGTAFSVRLRDAERVQVVVTQGRVAVQEHDAQPGHTKTLRSDSRTVSLLEAGQTADAKPSGIQVAKVEQGELTRRLAWQSGQLRFRNEALAEVVAEFNRYNRRQLEIVDPQLATLEVGGSFKANDLESFIVAMRNVSSVRIEESGDVIRLSMSPP